MNGYGKYVALIVGILAILGAMAAGVNKYITLEKRISRIEEVDELKEDLTTIDRRQSLHWWLIQAHYSEWQATLPPEQRHPWKDHRDHCEAMMFVREE